MFTPYSWITYNGDGTTDTFGVPFPYVAREHVHVYIGWDPSTRTFSTELVHDVDFTYASGTSIATTVAPATGTTITLLRETPIDEPLAEWQTGSPPTARELTTADLQVLYATQEYIDRTAQARADLDQAVFVAAQTVLIDNLNATLATAGLTANQGRVLRELIEAESLTTQGLIEAERVFTQTGVGAIPTTIAAKLQERVSVKDFGAVGDGVADDTAAIQAALAIGGQIYIPPGTYLLPNATNLYPAAHSRLMGAGAGISILKSSSNSLPHKLIWNVAAGDIEFNNLTLYHAGVANEVCDIVHLRGQAIKFAACEIKSDDTAVVDTAVQAFSFDHNLTASDIVIDRCNIHNVNRVLFKSNTTTCTASNISITNCFIHDLGQGGVQFNFPYGTASNVLITNNRFKNFHSGTEQIFCGGASLKGAVISNNVFEGSAKECVHLEEAGTDVTITGNLFSISSDALLPMRGIWFSANTVAGPSKGVVNIVVDGNVFTNAGTAGQHSGIEFKNESNAGTKIVISNNVFRDYEYGAELAGVECMFTGNYVSGATVGVKVADAGRPDISNNTFDTCGVGVQNLTNFGMIGSNTFINCTKVLETLATDATKASMTGFKVQVTGTTPIPASTTTTVNLPIGVGSEHWGHAKLTARFDVATLFRHRISELSFDGTTLSDTEKMMYGSGTIVASGFVNNSGTLAFSFNNTSGISYELKHFVVQFDGMWVSVD